MKTGIELSHKQLKQARRGCALKLLEEHGSAMPFILDLISRNVRQCFLLWSKE